MTTTMAMLQHRYQHRRAHTHPAAREPCSDAPGPHQPRPSRLLMDLAIQATLIASSAHGGRCGRDAVIRGAANGDAAFTGPVAGLGNEETAGVLFCLFVVVGKGGGGAHPAARPGRGNNKEMHPGEPRRRVEHRIRAFGVLSFHPLQHTQVT